ncbi:MAG: hypothetical protein M1832_000668 [Thelocarpon impressellum]|nr:MAG: hypothetical protein M1832_000668 [Thelocarpon impressellum]
MVEPAPSVWVPPVWVPPVWVHENETEQEVRNNADLLQHPTALTTRRSCATTGGRRLPLLRRQGLI